MADNQLLFDAVKTALERHGDKIVTVMRDKLLTDGKIATGDLYNSIQFEVTTEGDIISLNIHANSYLQYVSEGRKPGEKQPPPEAISKWVEIRGIKPRSYKLPSGKNRIQTTDSQIYLISRSIGKYGIKGNNVIAETLESQQDIILTDISQVIAGAITKLIGKEMQESANEAARKFVNNNVKITITYPK
jgi:hypothetical protein